MEDVGNGTCTAKLNTIFHTVLVQIEEQWFSFQLPTNGFTNEDKSSFARAP